MSLDVAAPIPAPTSPPTNAGPMSGQPASAATARPEPAPIAPPVAARWPHVSPRTDTDRSSGSRSAAKTLVFIVLNLRGGRAGGGGGGRGGGGPGRAAGGRGAA